MYDIFHLKGMSDVHDKSNLCRLGSVLQFRLSYLSLWAVGLDGFLEKSSKLLMSSARPLISQQTLMFRGLALPVLSLSHFLKLSLSTRDLPLFDNRPRASLVGSFFLIPFLYKGVESVLSTS